MWRQRMMEKISWTERASNENVLERVNEKRNSISSIKKSKENVCTGT